MANKRLKQELIEGMEALRQINAVKPATIRSFEKDLLEAPPEYSAQSIKSIREKTGVSQRVFAALLNVSTSTVQKWERGEKHPSGIANKLLDIVNNNGLNILIKG